MHLSTILLVAAVVWGGLLIVDGVVVSIEWLRHLPIVTGVLLLLLAAFDVLLWRVPVLHPWFVRRPVVHGTWRVSIRSTWTDPNSGQQIAPIEGFMSIWQTFSRLSLRLMTDESRSEFLGAEILRSEDGTYRIVGVYRNEPRVSVRHRSPIHNGGLAMQVLGAPPSCLEGHYWTDRGSAGELVLSDRRRKLVHSMAEARALYGAGEQAG
ncbi:MAG: hypothetical protein HY678_04740 [Chloroflexi bacterium]|nr:hypothetical protein [Chloroflexota bacterium]